MSTGGPRPRARLLVPFISTLFRSQPVVEHGGLADLRLPWGALHPGAREFLFTKGTLQQLSDEHAAYAMALIEGEHLEAWHGLSAWKGKA